MERLYLRGELEVKVELEKTNENGCPLLATGGTCEFIGKEMVGVAIESPARRKAVAQARAGDAIVVTVEVVLFLA